MRVTATFTLPYQNKYSLGLVDGDVLVRTVFSLQEFAPGKHVVPIELLPGEENLQAVMVGPGGELICEALPNAGVSSSYSRNNMHKGAFNFIWSFVIVNDILIYVNAAAERKSALHYAFLNNVQYRLSFDDFNQWGQRSISICADGNRCFMLGAGNINNVVRDFIYAVDVTDVLTEVTNFQYGEVFNTQYGRNYSSVAFLGPQHSTTDTAGYLGTLAVSGDYLYATDPTNDKLWVFNKNTLQPLPTQSIVGLGRACKVDAQGNLWLTIETNGSEQACKYTVNPDGSVTFADEQIGGFAVHGISFTPTGNIVLADGTTDVERIYQNGAEIEVFGNPDALKTNATVTDYSFAFNQAQGRVYDPDGSFWVLDHDNQRLMHFGADNQRIVSDTIAYRKGRLEAQFDLKKPGLHLYSDGYLDIWSGTQWTFAKSYVRQLPAEYTTNPYYRIFSPSTLEDGITYCLLRSDAQNAFRIAELGDTLAIMPGIVLFQSSGPTAVDEDFNIIRIIEDAGGVKVYRRLRTGKVNGTFTYAAEEILQYAPATEENESKVDDNISGHDCNGLLPNGAWIKYIPGVRSFKLNGEFSPAQDEHLKIFKNGQYLAKTLPATEDNYFGPLRKDHYSDNGQEINYLSVRPIAVNYLIYIKRNGEFMRGGQCNQTAIFHISGLMAAEKGVIMAGGYPDSVLLADATDEMDQFMAKNHRVNSVIYRDGFYYEATADEGWQAGPIVHKWSGLDTIFYQKVPLQRTAMARVLPNGAINLLEGLLTGGAPVGEEATHLQLSPEQTDTWYAISGKETVPEDEVQSLEIICQGPDGLRRADFILPETNSKSYVIDMTVAFSRLGWSNGDQYTALRLLDRQDNEIISFTWRDVNNTGLTDEYIFCVNDVNCPQFYTFGQKCMQLRKCFIAVSGDSADVFIGDEKISISKTNSASWQEPAKLGFVRTNRFDSGILLTKMEFLNTDRR